MPRFTLFVVDELSGGEVGDVDGGFGLGSGIGVGVGFGVGVVTGAPLLGGGEFPFEPSPPQADNKKQAATAAIHPSCLSMTYRSLCR